MRLDDLLHICLLAVADSFTECCVDINEELLGPQAFASKGHGPLDLIAHLHNTKPQLLRVEAHMMIDGQKSEIYLSAYSNEIPAFWIHCRGKMPLRQEYMRNIAYNY